MVNIDAEVSNADWTKGTWDLLDITTVDQLRKYLHQRGTTLDHFKTMPIYIQNVGKLEWLSKI